ncbi:hypothetical protein OROGR_027708 [Orobanche gracilis]
MVLMEHHKEIADYFNRRSVSIIPCFIAFLMLALFFEYSAVVLKTSYYEEGHWSNCQGA